MCAYNSVRGEPACANRLLFDTLRNKWGFQGYVVSDCWAISDLHQGHGFVLTLEQAAALAVKAGTDLSCGPEFGVLPLAVRNRLLSNDDIDRAVRRLFEARVRLRSEEHTSELQSPCNLVCRLLLEKKKKKTNKIDRLKKIIIMTTYLLMCGQCQPSVKSQDFTRQYFLHSPIYAIDARYDNLINDLR